MESIENAVLHVKKNIMTEPLYGLLTRPSKLFFLVKALIFPIASLVTEPIKPVSVSAK
jgi:hypothetical protein